MFLLECKDHTLDTVLVWISSNLTFSNTNYTSVYVPGHQCLCFGKRDWLGAVPGQRALLWTGQCKQKTFTFVAHHLFKFSSLCCVWIFVYVWVLTRSLETPATATPCSRLCTSAGHSGRRFWPTGANHGAKRTCSPAWLICSTASLTRRGRWGSSLQRSLSQGYGRKTVSGIERNGWEWPHRVDQTNINKLEVNGRILILY